MLTLSQFRLFRGQIGGATTLPGGKCPIGICQILSSGCWFLYLKTGNICGNASVVAMILSTTRLFLDLVLVLVLVLVLLVLVHLVLVYLVVVHLVLVHLVLVLVLVLLLRTGGCVLVLLLRTGGCWFWLC